MKHIYKVGDILTRHSSAYMDYNLRYIINEQLQYLFWRIGSNQTDLSIIELHTNNNVLYTDIFRELTGGIK